MYGLNGSRHITTIKGENNMSNHIIFSVFQSDKTNEVNRFNHNKALTFLTQNGVKYVEVDGCYKDSIEQSILISINHEAVANLLCNIYKQECYLKVDGNGNASLVYSNGSKIGYSSSNIGVWQQVTESVARSKDAYTHHRGSFYICDTINHPTPSLGSRL
jgi:hypothetical protein